MQLREKSSNISPVYRVNRRGMYDTPARIKPFFINNSRQAPTPANLNISLNYTIGWHEKVHDTQVPSSKITTYSETRRKNVILAKRRVEVRFFHLTSFKSNIYFWPTFLFWNENDWISESSAFVPKYSKILHCIQCH